MPPEVGTADGAPRRWFLGFQVHNCRRLAGFVQRLAGPVVVRAIEWKMSLGRVCISIRKRSSRMVRPPSGAAGDPGPTKVINVPLWTIQPIPAWDELRTTGVLRCPLERASAEWPEAYAWMREQMVRRVGPPPLPGVSPIWAWYWWDGRARPKPDLRYRMVRQNRVKGVRIEFGCPEGSALLSDYSDWSWVAISNAYRAASYADHNDFCRALKATGLAFGDTPTDPELFARFRRSWERIFDITVYRKGWTRKPEERSIQATVWEVRMEQVQEVMEFGGR